MVSDSSNAQFPDTEFPAHWRNPKVLSRQRVHDIQSCGSDELQKLQALFDATYRRVLTRDRQPDDEAPENEEMPYRLDVVQVFRSEHARLHHRFEQKRAQVEEASHRFRVKTAGVTGLDSQLSIGDGYLYH